MEVEAMTVVKLRAELKKRGSETTGLKSDLAARLKLVRKEQSGKEAAPKETETQPAEKTSGRPKRATRTPKKAAAAQPEEEEVEAAEAPVQATKKGAKAKKQTAAQAKKEKAEADAKAKKEKADVQAKKAKVEAQKKAVAKKAKEQKSAVAIKPTISKPKNAEHGLATHGRMFAGGTKHCIRPDERSGQIDAQWIKANSKTGSGVHCFSGSYASGNTMGSEVPQADPEAAKRVLTAMMPTADAKVLAVATSKGVAHLALRASANPTEHAKPRPCPVSGRWWKAQKTARSSASTIKNTSTWEMKQVS
jgi:hypothetical protein